MTDSVLRSISDRCPKVMPHSFMQISRGYCPLNWNLANTDVTSTDKTEKQICFSITGRSEKGIQDSTFQYITPSVAFLSDCKGRYDANNLKAQEIPQLTSDCRTWGATTSMSFLNASLRPKLSCMLYLADHGELNLQGWTSKQSNVSSVGHKKLFWLV